MPPVEPRLAALEKRVERVERIGTNLSRCIKVVWAVLAPLATGLLAKYVFGL